MKGLGSDRRPDSLPSTAYSPLHRIQNKTLKTVMNIAEGQRIFFILLCGQLAMPVRLLVKDDETKDSQGNRMKDFGRTMKETSPFIVHYFR